MNIKIIFLNLVFNCLLTSTAFGYQIAICGGGIANSEASLIEIEQFAREETERITDHSVLNVHRMCELLMANTVSPKKKKLFATGKQLNVDYIVRINIRKKEERLHFSTDLLDIQNNEIAKTSNLSFDANPPQLRRMVRIVLRELYDYFFELENPILVSKKTTL